MNSSQESYDEIWLIARRKERLKRWSVLYPEQKFRIFDLDLQKLESCKKIQRELMQREPEVTCFVHAAGFGIMGRIEEIPLEEQLEMIDVNCKSTVALTADVLPYMKKKGRIIVLSSAAAFLPQPGFAVYAASKSLVLSYMRSLRRESKGRGLRITAVCPGAVKTDFFDRAAAGKTLPAYKKLVMADMKKVVKKAWEDNTRNREISVYGYLMRGFYLACKLIPHRFILNFVKGD